MKKLISILIIATIILSISVTAAAATEEYPYMAESNEDLAFRDADGVFLKIFQEGKRSLYSDGTEEIQSVCG